MTILGRIFLEEKKEIPNLFIERRRKGKYVFLDLIY